MSFWPLALAVALVPGLYRWWMGRRFERSPDDPIQAERWLAYRTNASYVTLVSIGISAALAPDTAVILLPVVWLASTIGGFRVRRAVFREPWTLPVYLWWTARLAVGAWGFWILLGAAPWLELRSGSRAVTTCLAVILLLWQHWYATVLLVALRARRFDPGAESAALAAGFTRVLGRTDLPRPPEIWRAGPSQSVMANAVAIPSLTRPSVLFSNALVAALTPDETTAILGHEVAHLEDYSRRRWSLRLSTPVLVLLTTLLIPRLPYPEITPAIWAVVLAVALSARAQLRQRRESDSDRRAVELSGDWDALSRALITLHSMGRVPRRWSESFEQRASHPSLARRLAALRAIGGAAASPITPTVVAGSDGSTWVTVESDRVRHLARVPAGTPQDPAALAAAAGVAVTIPYERVRELRVMASGAGGAAIRIRDVDGGTWTCAVSPADVRRVQAALDGVDHRISHAAPETSLHRIGMLASAAIALAGILVSAPALAVLGFFTALVPSRAASAAAAAGVSVVLTGYALHLPWIAGRAAWPLAVLVAATILVAIQAVRTAGAPSPRRTWLLVGMLVVSSLIVWTAIAIVAATWLDVHQLLRACPAAVALPAACAGALWGWPGKRRWAALATLLTACAALAIAPQFVTHVVRDPLEAIVPMRAVQPLPLRRIASVAAPRGVMELRIAPDGRHYAVARVGEDDEPTGTFLFGDIEGGVTAIEALDVEFLDAGHVLVLMKDGVAERVSLRDVAAVDRVLWDTRIEAPDDSDLLVNAATGRWRVTGRSRDELVRIDGTVGGAPPAVTRWTPAPANRDQWLVDDDDTAIGLRRDVSPMIGPASSLRYLMNVGVPLMPGSLYAMRRGEAPRLVASSSMQIECVTPVPGTPVVCAASDRQTTTLWTIQRGVLRATGAAATELIALRQSPDGLLTAWTRTGEIFLEGDRLLTPAGDAAKAPVGEWTSAGRVLGTLEQLDDSATVSTYERTSSAAAMPSPDPRRP